MRALVPACADGVINVLLCFHLKPPKVGGLVSNRVFWVVFFFPAPSQVDRESKPILAGQVLEVATEGSLGLTIKCTFNIFYLFVMTEPCLTLLRFTI